MKIHDFQYWFGYSWVLITEMKYARQNEISIYSIILITWILKPMDSFGICDENQMKLIFFIES